MEINAIAYLEYQEESTITYEGLYLNVKFKEERKIFKTRLREGLVVYNPRHSIEKEKYPYDTKEDYYDLVESVINDENYIKEEAGKIVEEYLEFVKTRDNISDRQNNIIKTVDKLKPIEVKVKIK